MVCNVRGYLPQCGVCVCVTVCGYECVGMVCNVRGYLPLFSVFLSSEKQPFKADLSVNPPTVTEGGGPLIIRMIISREAKPLGDDWPDPEVNITFTLHVKSTAGTAEGKIRVPYVSV